MTQHPDEGTLHAYVDGELPRTEAEALESHVAVCASCAAALAEARGLVAAASRAISALDAAPAAARVAARPAAGPAAAPTHAVRPPIFRVPYARAAALLLLVGGTAIVLDRSGTFNRGQSSRGVSTMAEAPLSAPEMAAAALEPAIPATAATAATAATPATPATPANAQPGSGALNRSTTAVADAAMPVAQKTESPPRMATEATIDSTTRARGVERGLALAAPPPPPPRPVEATLSEVVTASAASRRAPVSRYRTREGVILTLTEEPLLAAVAEERATAGRIQPRGVQQSAAAAASAPAVNSYRWSSAEKGLSYTLTGPLTVAELEALSKRLNELERMP